MGGVGTPIPLEGLDLYPGTDTPAATPSTAMSQCSCPQSREDEVLVAVKELASGVEVASVTGRLGYYM